MIPRSPPAVPHRTARPPAGAFLLLPVLWLGAPLGASPADSGVVPVPPRFVWKSDLLLPLTSAVLPGFGQYVQFDNREGLCYSAAGAGGLLLGYSAVRDGIPVRDSAATMQRVEYGFSLYGSAGFVSAFRTFMRSVPRFQKEDGRYLFLDGKEGIGDLLRAPLNFRYLENKRTLIPLGSLTVLMLWVLSAPDSLFRDIRYSPYELHDVLFTAGISYNAGVSEELLFRGYLHPFLYERLGRHWWISNGLQALIFGALHYSEENRLPVVQTLLGFHLGWVARRGNWSLGESIFIHFWWDVIALTAAFLIEEKGTPVSLYFSLPY